MSKLLTPLLATTAMLALAACSACTAESSVKLDEDQVKALKAFDYGDWEYTLNTYVDGEGKVDYAALKQDRGRLDTFVALLAEVGPETREDLFPRREDRLAFHINAYNAFTMFNVLNRYPDIETVYADKVDFFGLTFFKMDGGRTNLNDLEQKLIRPRYKEPRVHFALNCASASCPVLPNTFFDPDKLEDQLKAETDKFLHEPRNVTLKGNEVVLSQIFEWYAEDFSPSNLEWIRDRAPDLGIPESAVVSYTPYDWSLNDQNR
jgi:hypothetical protein